MPPSLTLICNPTLHYSILKWPSTSDVTSTLKIMIDETSRERSFFSITSTSAETSVVIDDVILETMSSSLDTSLYVREEGWIAFSIDTSEPIPFDLVGILLSIAKPLADAKIGIFALSTFNTDHVLIKEANLEKAKEALEEAGHIFKLAT